MAPEGFGKSVHFHIQLGYSVELLALEVVVLVTFDMGIFPLSGAVLQKFPDSRGQVKICVLRIWDIPLVEHGNSLLIITSNCCLALGDVMSFAHCLAHEQCCIETGQFSHAPSSSPSFFPAESTTPQGFDHEAAARQLLQDIEAAGPAQPAQNHNKASLAFPGPLALQAHRLPPVAHQAPADDEVSIQPKALDFSQDSIQPLSNNQGTSSNLSPTTSHTLPPPDSSPAHPILPDRAPEVNRNAALRRSGVPATPLLQTAAEGSAKTLWHDSAFRSLSFSTTLVHQPLSWLWQSHLWITRALEFVSNNAHTLGIRVLIWQPHSSSEVPFEVAIPESAQAGSDPHVVPHCQPQIPTWAGLLLRVGRNLNLGDAAPANCRTTQSATFHAIGAPPHLGRCLKKLNK